MFSSLPPPIGGVTRSVENLLRALDTKNIYTSVISQRPSIGPLFTRYDIVHIHYSKSWKRLLGLILGKIIAKKVIFTLHGNNFLKDPLNLINQNLVDGVILLNQDTNNKYKHLFKNTVVLDSLFKEGIEELNSNTQTYFTKDEKKTYLLLYTFDKIFINSKEVYGATFILENLQKLNEKYVLVFLDIKGAYRNEIHNMNNDAIIYLDYEVNFFDLLSQIDIYIRPTTNDGASVAIQEALMLGKKVLASDIVDRPKEVTTYKSGDFDDFNDKLENLKDIKGFVPNSIDKYIDFCNELLEK